ncbi:MAG: hypothetical protein APR53_07555 [Methanoculleus sp. SDB]|nr:MAG: hypothetical protein APR53_07555 [Methanoculleus sp. SDB]
MEKKHRLMIAGAFIIIVVSILAGITLLNSMTPRTETSWACPYHIGAEADGSDLLVMFVYDTRWEGSGHGPEDVASLRFTIISPEGESHSFETADLPLDERQRYEGVLTQSDEVIIVLTYRDGTSQVVYQNVPEKR